MLERGVVIRSDVLRAEVLVGNLERQRIDANNATQWSRSRLAYIIGSPLEIPLADHDAWPELGEPSSLEESTRIALERRPDLQALENQWRASEAALRQARGDYLPSVGVVGQYELNSKELERFGDSYAVFVGARWNLFNGLATNGKVSEANANATRARMMRDDLAARIRVEVEEAWRGLAGATTQIQVAQRSGAQAKENLAILRDRYSTGLSKSVDVLDAVATAAQADLEILRAQVNRQLRRAELDLATGEPVPAADTEEQ
jgi:outer membrane protein